VRYGDITVLFDLFKQYGLIELLNGLLPRRGLPVGEVFASLAINHIIDRETLNKFSGGIGTRHWKNSPALPLGGIMVFKVKSDLMGF